MRAVALFVIVLSLVATSQAEPTLLIALHSRGQCYDCYPIGPRFYFSATGEKPNGGGYTLAEWKLLAMQSDVGRTFSAPPDVIADFTAALTSKGYLSVNTQFTTGAGGTGNVYTSYSSAVTYGSQNESLPVTRFAPTLGPNLSGYYITDITHTIESMEFNPISASRYRASTLSTIRIYGEVVPEPATWLLVTCAIASLLSLRRGPPCDSESSRS